MSVLDEAASLKERPMSTTIPSFTIDLNLGSVGPAWTLEVALQAAREVETGGLRATCIRRGPDVILDNAALRKALDN